MNQIPGEVLRVLINKKSQNVAEKKVIAFINDWDNLNLLKDNISNKIILIALKPKILFVISA